MTMMIAFVNRYEIREANPDNSEGRLLALAEQKRLAFKERLTFYSDPEMTRRVY